MSEPLLSRTFTEWLLVTAFCAGLAGLSAAQGWLWRLDQTFYDAAIVSRYLPADPDVVVVAIDDRSLAEIGRWPWSRAVHALLLERLAAAGSSVVALDIILSEAAHHDPAGDAALAHAIAAHGQVVLPVVHASHAARSDGETRPDPRFAAVAAALGHIQIELDPDGIARSIYLWEGMHLPRHPQLALAALGLAAPDRAATYAAPSVAAISEWQRAGWMRVPFAGPPGTFRYVSYVDVLRGNVPDELFRDAVVFVGATAVGMGDIVPTPASGHTRPMPGVEMNATIFSALRKGETIHSTPAHLSGLISALLVTVLMIVMLRAGPRASLLTAFFFVAGWLLVVGVALAFGRLWLPPVGAALGCMLAYPLWSWRRLETMQHYLDAELATLRETTGGFALTASVVENETGVDRMAARIATVREVARRQRALQRFVTDTLDSLPVGVVVTDPQGEVQLSNRRAAALVKAPGATAIKAALAALPWPATLPPPGAAPKLDGGARQAEIDLADGRALLLSVQGLRGEEGAPLGTVLGIADITAVRDAQRGREETLHILSHDLRTPLASIVTLVDTERAGGRIATPREADRLGRMERYARSALALADNLFRLLRAEHADPGDFVELPIEVVMQDAADEVWDLARSKEVRLNTAVDLHDDDTPPLVRGDGDLLCRALVNLLTNAIKYTPPGGEITFALRPLPGQWAIDVIDTGPGIDPGQQARLFRRFSRLPTAENRRLEGVGLGLLMVRGVAERHGGTVTVHSRPDAGSRFTLILPAA